MCMGDLGKIHMSLDQCGSEVDWGESIRFSILIVATGLFQEG